MKKTLLTFGCILLVGTTGMANAMPPPPNYDSDGDGQTTAAEIQAGRSADFKQMDTNADNALTLGELQDWFAGKTSERFKALDTDGNGALDPSEFAADKNRPGDTSFSARLFKLADTDGNGALSTEEFKVAFSSSDHVLHMFAFMDSNSDNTLSLEEFLAAPAPRGRQGERRGGNFSPPQDPALN